MVEKPSVLVLAGRYRPGYRSGGPVASLENLVEALREEFDFRVLALDRDVGDESPFPPGERRREATYLAADEAARTVRDEVRRAPGIVYVQTLFDPLWGILPLLLTPASRLLVSPRGQLAPGALAYGRLKKSAVLRLLQARGLGRALWQATAERDVAEIRAAAPWIDPENIVLAPNLPSDPGFTLRRKPAGRLKAIYVGRIDPKKNLLTAARAAALASVHLEVVGPPENAAYAEECRQAGGSQIAFLGALPPEAVRERLKEADVFLFPTQGENYGHAIVEAMLSGLPALIGNTTPWRDLEAQGAGFDLPPDDTEGFVQALRRLAAMSEAEFAPWSQGSRTVIEALTEREAAIAASREMLRHAAERSVEKR